MRCIIAEKHTSLHAIRSSRLSSSLLCVVLLPFLLYLHAFLHIVSMELFIYDCISLYFFLTFASVVLLDLQLISLLLCLLSFTVNQNVVTSSCL